jgi:phage-related protein
MPSAAGVSLGGALNSHQLWYSSSMSEPGDNQPILEVAFYATSAGNEPVREWLVALAADDRRAVGFDIKTAQYGWPLGMPLIRKLEPGLWEVRPRIGNGIARVLFTVDGDTMVLLHGFVKKSQKTPAVDLDTAKRRLADLRKG